MKSASCWLKDKRIAEWTNLTVQLLNFQPSKQQRRDLTTELLHKGHCFLTKNRTRSPGSKISNEVLNMSNY